MFNLKSCPFCGGRIRVISRIEHIGSIETKAECIRCRMDFTYEQQFAYSKDGRLAINDSFEEIWNNRIKGD